MRNCNCDLCGSAERLNFPSFITQPQFVVICRNCGLIYTNPCWDQNEIEEIYNNVFRDDPGAPANCSRSDIDAYRGARFNEGCRQARENLLPLLTKFVDPLGKKWLEVRFRSGGLAYELSKLGVKILGVDLFAGNVRWLKSILPEADIYRRDAGDLLNFQENDFDVISMVSTHVVAHVPSPTALFEAAYAKLRAGGILFIDEKDVTQISPQAALFPFQFPYGMAHYHHLTLPVATAFLRKVGFDILSAEFTDRRTAQRHFLIVARKPVYRKQIKFTDSKFELNNYKKIYRTLLWKYFTIRQRQIYKGFIKRINRKFIGLNDG